MMFGRTIEDDPHRARREARLGMLRATEEASVRPAPATLPKPLPRAEAPTVSASSRPAPRSCGALATLASVVQFLAVALLIAGVGFFAGGFLRFVQQVETYDTLATTEPGPADAIVVLTGGPNRLETSGALLEAQRARHLLVSGVNLRTTEPQIRNLLGVEDDLFTCCVELGFEARDTRGNAREGASWFARLSDEESGPLAGGTDQRVILVTSNYHMQRSLHEFRRLMPEVELVPHAVRGLDMQSDDWWREAGNWRLLMGEYAKFLLASARDYPTIATVLNGFLSGGERA